MYRRKPRATQRNAICDVCGFKYKHFELQPRWDGMMVCRKDWEPRHPLDFFRVRRTEKPPAWVRPENTNDESWGTVIVTDQNGVVYDPNTGTVIILPDGTRIVVYFEPDTDAPWIDVGATPDIDVIIDNNGTNPDSDAIDTTYGAYQGDMLHNQFVGSWDPETTPVGQTNSPNLIVHGAIVISANPNAAGRSQGSYYTAYTVEPGTIKISVRVAYQDPNTGTYYTKYHPWAGLITASAT